VFGRRRIVVASTARLKDYPYTSAYYAMKHDALGLTLPELGDSGATINGTCTGFIETSMLAA
jgi:NAD(P)-dependent dehydrogenase (short-subunit alcohol dehydrogenase family)